MSTVAQWLRPVVRVMAEPVMRRMAQVIAVARERGASDQWVEQQLLRAAGSCFGIGSLRPSTPR